jgi:hypothetical protein
MCNTRSTFETFECNTAINKRLMKHLKYASETLAKTIENHRKHMQHPNKTLATYV